MRTMASKKAVKSKPKAPPSKPRKDDAQDSRCTIVGFGASAGGLEAFSEVLAHTPSDAGMGIVFVQHLDPKHPSALVELLARSSSSCPYRKRRTA